MGRDWMAEYEAGRAELASRHDEGAGEAVRGAVLEGTSVGCGSYCYGGSVEIDAVEVLAELAEAGWRLTRVDPSASGA